MRLFGQAEEEDSEESASSVGSHILFVRLFTAALRPNEFFGVVPGIHQVPELMQTPERSEANAEKLGFYTSRDIRDLRKHRLSCIETRPQPKW